MPVFNIGPISKETALHHPEFLFLCETAMDAENVISFTEAQGDWLQFSEMIRNRLAEGLPVVIVGDSQDAQEMQGLIRRIST